MHPVGKFFKRLQFLQEACSTFHNFFKKANNIKKVIWHSISQTEETVGTEFYRTDKSNGSGASVSKMDTLACVCTNQVGCGKTLETQRAPHEGIDKESRVHCYGMFHSHRTEGAT